VKKFMRERFHRRAADRCSGGPSGEAMLMAVGRNVVPSVDPRFARFPLRVGRSRIHCFGVFAAKTIPGGRKVIEYTGERLSQRQARHRQRRARRRGGPKIDKLFRLNRYWSVDGAVGGSGAELINHCCDPNLKTRRIRGHLLYFSGRRIRPGEELTADYRFPAKAERIVCRCGSAKCRGTINWK
jgi:SET domain-containing protein